MYFNFIKMTDKNFTKISQQQKLTAQISQHKYLPKDMSEIPMEML